jgi:hypothetical protein
MSTFFAWLHGRWYRLLLLVVIGLLVVELVLFIWGVPTAHFTSGGVSVRTVQNAISGGDS